MFVSFVVLFVSLFFLLFFFQYLIPFCWPLHCTPPLPFLPLPLSFAMLLLWEATGTWHCEERAVGEWCLVCGWSLFILKRGGHGMYHHARWLLGWAWWLSHSSCCLFYVSVFPHLFCNINKKLRLNLWVKIRWTCNMPGYQISCNQRVWIASSLFLGVSFFLG